MKMVTKQEIAASSNPIIAQVFPVLTFLNEVVEYKWGVSWYNLLACFDKIKAMIPIVRLITPAKQNKNMERIPKTSMVEE